MGASCRSRAAGAPYFSIFFLEAFMAVKVKPVQATVIRDKKIVRQVIAEVRRRPSARRLAKLEEEAEFVMSMVK
jgi:hypothetical protein